MTELMPNTSSQLDAVLSSPSDVQDARLWTAIRAAQEKKAFDIVILGISQVTSFADYFLLCSGSSTRQTEAIASEIEKKLGEQGTYTNHKEGAGEWILFDYGDIIIHVFTKETRAFYDLERLWRDGRRINIPNESE
ncbi:MAG TPA: ribosome silencing factor [Acidobacteriota bacterium]|nr:ribosome silencing factor [Acidobacteriota bacterium]HNB71064.1 ribosome silencing factor [Acidobacteriota bacterium]HNC42809.1 ribosome silencing factor [Acidobacteriota bacterium]HND18512.1 ribosome silencing factor [Acidobacteriota bacterium]HNG95270.1 ribosome silencing factor [Acidobacteriota bacterium]